MTLSESDYIWHELYNIDRRSGLFACSDLHYLGTETESLRHVASVHIDTFGFLGLPTGHSDHDQDVDMDEAAYLSDVSVW